MTPLFKEKSMKRFIKVKYFLWSLLLVAVFIFPIHRVQAKDNEENSQSTDIKELTVGLDLFTRPLSDKNMWFYKSKQISDNIFYVDAGSEQNFGDLRFTGVLSSSDAEVKITNMSDPDGIGDEYTSVEYDYAFRPKESGTRGGEKIDNLNGERPFHSLSRKSDVPGSTMMELPRGGALYKLTVTDGNNSKDYYVIISFRAKAENDVTKDRVNMPDTINLLDKNSIPLEDKYQYAKNITDWEDTSVAYGVSGTTDKNIIPDEVQSIHLSLSRGAKVPETAYFEPTLANMPDRFYRQNSYCYSVNGGEFHNVSGNGISGEIVLQQGYNIIHLINTTKDNFPPSKLKGDYGSCVLLLYREGENTYERSKSTSQELGAVQIYQAAESKAIADKKPFNELLNTKDEPLSTDSKIKLTSASPYVFIMAEAQDPDSKIEIPNSKSVDGGYLVKYDHERDATVNINVIPEEGDAQITQIPIEWTVSDASLNSLEVLKNGKMTSDYSKDKKEYYLVPDDMEEPVTLKYNCSDKLDININRADKYGESVIPNEENTVTVDPKTQHQVSFKVTAKDDTVNYYTVVLKRENISDHSEAVSIAKPYLNKVMEYYKTNKGKNRADGSYWDIFAMTAAEESLDNYSVYNVLNQKRAQATDYAGIILELVMLGENPFDYGGVNFVELLQNCRNDQGNYGPYACNIYALYALDAVGIEDDQLVQIVSNQAKSKSFDLDMRGWAVAAIQNHFDQPDVEEKSALAIENFKTTQGLGPIPGAFENSWYYNSNAATQSCVIMGLTAAGINLQDEEWRCQGNTPVEYYKNCFDENGNPTSNLGKQPTQVIIALAGIVNNSCVFPDNALTLGKVETLLNEAKKTRTDKVLQEKIDDASETLQKLYDSDNGVVTGIATGMGQAYFELNDLVGVANDKWKDDTFMGSEDQKKAVADIEKEVSDLSIAYANKDKILAVKDAYAKLSEYSTNGEEGTLMLQHYVKKTYMLKYAMNYIDIASELINAVDSIGIIDQNSKMNIEKAFDIYNDMDDDMKQDGSISKAFVDLENDKKIYEVITEITNLPKEDELSLEHEEAVKHARASYDSLDKELKVQVSNADILISAEKKIENLHTVKTVEDMIVDLPDPDNISYEDDHEAVMKTYNEFMSLTEEQKGLISKELQEKLMADYDIIRQQQGDSEAVQEVIDSIAEIPSLEDLTLENKTLVDQARGLYDSLSTDELKTRVSNYHDLEAAEEKLKELASADLIDQIHGLPDPDELEGTAGDGSDIEVTRETLDAIANAKGVYDAMDETAQGIFTNEYPKEHEKLMALDKIAKEYEGYVDEVMAPLVETIRNFGLPVTKENIKTAGDIISRYHANESAQTYLNSIVWEDGTSLEDKMQEIEEQFDLLQEDMEEASNVDGMIEELPDTVNEDNYKEIQKSLDKIQKAYDQLSDQGKELMTYQDRWQEVQQKVSDYQEGNESVKKVTQQIEDAVSDENDLLDEDTVINLKAAEAAYQNLTPSEQKQVPDELVESMKKMEEEISEAKTKEAAENKDVKYNGTVPWDVVIKIERVAQSEESYDSLQDALKDDKNASLLQVFEVQIYQILEDGSHKEFIPEGGISLTVEAEEDLTGKTAVIGHLKEDGSVEYLDAQIKENEITFTTKSLSAFGAGVVEEEKAEDPKHTEDPTDVDGPEDDSKGAGNKNNGNNNGNGNGNGSATKTGNGNGNKNTENKAVPGKANGQTSGGKGGVPKTGDLLAERANVMIVLLAISGIALAICLRKKREQNV